MTAEAQHETMRTNDNKTRTNQQEQTIKRRKDGTEQGKKREKEERKKGRIGERKCSAFDSYVKLIYTFFRRCNEDCGIGFMINRKIQDYSSIPTVSINQ